MNCENSNIVPASLYNLVSKVVAQIYSTSRNGNGWLRILIETNKAMT